MDLEERTRRWLSKCLKKARYHSFELAEEVAKRRPIALGIYYCTECFGYHQYHLKEEQDALQTVATVEDMEMPRVQAPILTASVSQV